MLENTTKEPFLNTAEWLITSVVVAGLLVNILYSVNLSYKFENTIISMCSDLLAEKGVSAVEIFSVKNVSNSKEVTLSGIFLGIESEFVCNGALSDSKDTLRVVVDN